MNIKQILSNFTNRVSRLLGIDIGPNFIRLVELSYYQAGYQLEACLHTTMNEQNLSDEMIIVAIKDLLEQAQPKTKNVAVAMAHSAVIFKEIQVDPSLTSKEVEEFLCFNLKEQFGDDVRGNINFDYQACATKPNLPIKLQVVVVQQERVKKLVRLLQAAKLHPKIIDVDVYALERAVRWQLKNIEGLVAIIHINHGNILIMVLSDKKIIYINDDVVKYENLDSLAKIEEQIDLKLHAVYQAILQPLNQIVLAGEVATFLGLAEAVSLHLKIQTVLANPFLGMQLAANVSQESINHVAPMMLTSAGLALRVADGTKN